MSQICDTNSLICDNLTGSKLTYLKQLHNPTVVLNILVCSPEKSVKKSYMERDNGSE